MFIKNLYPPLRTLAFLFLFCLSSLSHSKELKPFYSDGCTFFIEGNWGPCCFEHDLRYWFGGSLQEQLHADLHLRSCVREFAGNFWAETIYRAVRFGHYSPIKAKTEWSWGWTEKRNWEDLSVSEKDHVIQELQKLHLEPQFREQFVEKYLK